MKKMESIVKEWGNSLGVIIPNDIAKNENIKAGDSIEIIVLKKNNIKKAFGSLKNLKIDTQKFKDDLRKEDKKNDRRKEKLFFR